MRTPAWRVVLADSPEWQCREATFFETVFGVGTMGLTIRLAEDELYACRATCEEGLPH